MKYEKDNLIPMSLVFIEDWSIEIYNNGADLKDTFSILWARSSAKFLPKTTIELFLTK